MKQCGSEFYNEKKTRTNKSLYCQQEFRGTRGNMSRYTE